ncbi:MAG: hypothetical protein ACFFC3_02165, partial [Candidatus Odinarchaeota archaeon]
RYYLIIYLHKLLDNTLETLDIKIVINFHIFFIKENIKKNISEKTTSKIKNRIRYNISSEIISKIIK